MATVETTRYVDDLTGGDADETVVFGLDGDRFEIDLSAGNAERLRSELAPFLQAARTADTPGARRARVRAASGPGRAGRSAGAAKATHLKAVPPAPAPAAPTVAVPEAAGAGAGAPVQNHVVRAWARENGFTVSERGRIPAEVVAAYHRGRPADGPSTGTETTGAEATAGADDTRAEKAPTEETDTGTGTDESAAANTDARATEAPGPMTVLFSG